MHVSNDYPSIRKFLSYVLRHEPHTIGITLDAEGWAEIDALVIGAHAAGKTLDAELIRAVVASSDKKRFALSDNAQRIRAVQGHSTDSVAIEHEPKQPPEFLYHVPDSSSISIRTAGLPDVLSPSKQAMSFRSTSTFANGIKFRPSRFLRPKRPLPISVDASINHHG
jgi:RNA:NAD 2'-phosphotransferase (TPT1/KptA family)